MRWLLPIMFLLLGAGGFAALKASKPQTHRLETREKAWIVSVEQIRIADIAPTLTLYGRVESPRAAKLSAALTADVLSVEVLEGQTVNAGQVLATLDGRETHLLLMQREADVADMQAQIQSERARHRNDVTSLGHEKRLLELVSTAAQRARDLASTNVGSKSQLDEALQEEARQRLAVDNRSYAIEEFESRIAQFHAKLASARALRDLALLDVSRATITAPFNGRVADVMIAPGDRVRGGDGVLRVYDTSSIEIRAQIPIRYLPAIRDSLENGARLMAHATVDDRPISAMLDRLTGEVAPGRGGVDALFRVQAHGEWLQLGRSVELILTLPVARAVVALPLEAIYGVNRIYKLEGERLVAVNVTRVGEFTDTKGQTSVLLSSPDLANDDRVVVTQLPNAIDGLKVRIAGGG